MKKSFLLPVIGSALLGMTACSASPPQTTPSPTDSPVGQSAPSAAPSAPASPSPSPSISSSSPAANPSSSEPATVQSEQSGVKPNQIAANSTKTSTSATLKEMTVYRLDDQCNGYVSEKLPMPVQGVPEAIVAKVLQNSNNPDFSVANYRVNVSNGVATIDFRLPANAKRPFQALSTCEQMALLGSIDKTLKANTSLNIQAVRFTDGKEELMF
jgi:hypothetical protein